MIPIMEAKKTISAEEKWKQGGTNHSIRFEMLSLIGESRCFASVSWKKLPYLLRINLSARKWAA